MQHILFGPDLGTFKFAILIKQQGLIKQKLVKHYLNEMESAGIDRQECIAFSVPYNTPKKVVAKDGKEYLDQQLLPILERMNTEYLLVADPNYFKYLTKESKTEPHHGYVLPCKLKGWENKFHVVLVPNHQATFHNPDIQDKIDMDVRALIDHATGQYEELGTGIIHHEEYHSDLPEIRKFLTSLHQYPEITCDTETFSLKHARAGLGTIGFAWNEHEGGVLDVDKRHNMLMSKEHMNNCLIRYELRKFFETYKGTITYHNGAYDIKILIYNLFMQSLLDQKGLLEGLEVLTRKFHDTKIITYLATNNTGGNHLSLKEQAHEFAGNYAQEEIDDISKIESQQLMTYNLIDCLSTWYVKKKHWQTMVDDNQLDIYNTIMIPSLKVIIQMELTGMCLDIDRVRSAYRRVSRNLNWFNRILQSDSYVQDVIKYKKTVQLIADNKKLKTKVRTMDELSHIDFNPGSTKDVQILLHDVLKYPVIDKTDSKQPAVGAKTLKKHINLSAQSYSEKKILRTLIDISDAAIIKNNFLKNFLDAEPAEDGMHYLFGSFNLGGTVSGRLSSSNPNLQNIPSSGTPYAKMVKRCFVAPPGWIFCGADFASLEDRISALTTKDPYKLKVYTDGYDGHTLRAANYFPEEYSMVPQMGENDRGFKVTQEDGTTHWIKSGTMVMCPDGKNRTIEEYYDSV